MRNFFTTFTQALQAFVMITLLGLSFIAQGEDKTPYSAENPFKIGLIYPGPITDFGYSYQHAQSIQAVKDKYGDAVELTHIESVPEGPQAEQILSRLAQEHHMIFATSFGFMNYVVKVARKNPNVVFEHATGYKRADNISTYMSRFYEGRYIQGLIAGHMTKTDHIGYIAAYPIPEVIRGLNAFAIGLKQSNPDAKMTIIWANTWYDPAKEGEAARTLIDQGADILAQHTDSAAPMQIAEEKGIYAFGQATDMQRFGPNAQLTALVDDWSVYYLKRVEQAMAGTWESQDVWDGFDQAMLSMAPFHKDIPEAAAQQAQEAIDQITSKDLHVFTGPLTNQSGTIVAEEGQVISDEELLKMDYYLDLISAKLP